MLDRLVIYAMKRPQNVAAATVALLTSPALLTTAVIGAAGYGIYKVIKD